MSLWTPDGERPVERGDDPRPTTPTPMAEDLETDEAEARRIAAEMAKVRDELGRVPAAVVIANHAMGCYELAAIHLSSAPPKLDEAQLAIDAFGALVETVSGRLGDDEQTLVDALSQIRLAFVQIKASADAAPAPGAAGDAAPTDGTAAGEAER